MENDLKQVNPIGVAVYFIVSPEIGPSHYFCWEEDVLASGGVHAIERKLEKECYWFVYLGKVGGTPTSIYNDELVKLLAESETVH